MTSNAPTIRQILSGPVRAIASQNVLQAQGQGLREPRTQEWLEKNGMVLGFYDDGPGK